MAICPFAVQQIIPESYSQGRITPTTLIYHRAVSSAESLLGYWTTPGVELESHFYIGQFGTIYQFMDTSVRADANMDANGFAISVETWDGGNTPDSMTWSPAQLAAAKRLASWVCETHGIRRGAAQTWNGGGIGGHNWFPYPWAGGPRGCPGTARNAQIRNDIIPYVAAGGGWRTSIEEDDMAGEGPEILAMLRNLNNWMLHGGPGPDLLYAGKPVPGLSPTSAVAVLHDTNRALRERMGPAIVELLKRGVADVDESALADELAKRGFGNVDPGAIKSALAEVLTKGTESTTKEQA